MKTDPYKPITPYVNNNYSQQKTSEIKGKAKSIESQFQGQVSNVSFIYSDDGVEKAVVTIKTDKETAKKIASNSTDVQVRVIIDENLEKIKTKEANKEPEEIKFDMYSTDIDADLINKEDNDFAENTYSYYRSSDGKIYASVGKNKEDDTPTSVLNTKKNNLTTPEQNQRLYKKYNFKNIKYKDLDENKFNLLV